jgi:hypothetical protein
MSMNAEQYRALVNKLEAINEAPLDDPAPGAQDDVTGVDAQVAQQAASADLANKYKPNDGITEIEARSLAQAHAIAAKQGLKQFRWCSTYKTSVAKKKPPQAGKPTTGRTPIQPSVGMSGIKDKTNGWSNSQVDALNLAAAGNQGA